MSEHTSRFSDLDPGFYWITLNGEEPEIAPWDAEGQVWFLTAARRGWASSSTKTSR